MPGPDPDGPTRSSDGSKLKRGLKAAGSSLQESGRDEMDRASQMSVRPVAYRKGGKVRKKARGKTRRK